MAVEGRTAGVQTAGMWAVKAVGAAAVGRRGTAMLHTAMPQPHANVVCISFALPWHTPTNNRCLYYLLCSHHTHCILAQTNVMAPPVSPGTSRLT